MKAIVFFNKEDLLHYGVQGQRWGIRRYQDYPSWYTGNGRYIGQRSSTRTRAQSAGFGYSSRSGLQPGTQEYIDMMRRRDAARNPTRRTYSGGGSSSSGSAGSSRSVVTSRSSSRSGGASGGKGSSKKTSGGSIKESTKNISEESNTTIPTGDFGFDMVREEWEKDIDATGYSSTKPSDKVRMSAIVMDGAILATRDELLKIMQQNRG